MADVFISYAREDSERAEVLVLALEDRGLSVFLDQTIRPGAPWTSAILDQLESARIVLVLWSASSIGSIWVLGEAAKAAQRRALLPVQLDDSRLPFPFDRLQCSSLVDWDGSQDGQPLIEFVDRVHRELGTSRAYGNVEPVAPEEAVDRRHLHLIDTTWRDEEWDAEFHDGRAWYQLRVIVFGHRSAISRVERVVYHLPGYPAGHERQERGPEGSEDCFLLKELANGFSVVQAEVHLRGQPDGSPRVLRLARFILLSETGPRLEPFIHQARPEVT